MSKEYITKPKHVRVVQGPQKASSQLEANPYLPPTTIPDRPWNLINKSTWLDNSDDEDLDHTSHSWPLIINFVIPNVDIDDNPDTDNDDSHEQNCCTA